MKNIDRRSALALSLAATSAVVMTESAMAQPYGANEGKEVSPGVRQVDLGKRDAMIPGYKTVSMRDIVFQPGAKISPPPMPNDMICHVAEGELRIKQSEGMEFVAKKGDVWTCKKGIGEDSTNAGSGVGIMRVIDLLTV
jgi:quercetin dioxygenase-like cupin family protein